ncbi:MAG: class I SAM-dependent methyltransferase [Candidatus Omnitrophota bacterium]|nr:class I SAM-dependent methyltransferase [Candidatus Omnitrophota bacterium]
MKFVTLVTQDYLPGFYALMQSIADHGGLEPSAKFLVLYADGQVLRHAPQIRKFGFQFEFLDIHTLGKAHAPLAERGRNKFQIALQKLLIFKIPSEEKLCFIDSDMLCLNSLDGVYAMEHFSIAPDKPKKYLRDRLPVLNTGFMVFSPSSALYDEITEYINQSSETFDWGDNGVLNHFFYDRRPEEIHLVDRNWNMRKKAMIHQPKSFDLKKIRLLHFVGNNPWTHFAGFLAVMAYERDYLSLNILWWNYYLRSQLAAGFLPASKALIASIPAGFIGAAVSFLDFFKFAAGNRISSWLEANLKSLWANTVKYARIKYTRKIPARQDFPLLLRSLKAQGKGVEIGVAQGRFSEFLLKSGEISHLVCIDPWKEQSPDVYQDVNHVSDEEYERRYWNVSQRLKKYGEKSRVMRMTSEEAAPHFDRETLDFAYIDANHSYEAVKQDLELWWDKVKPGGIFAGHDYLNGKLPEGNFGVRRAVDEFVEDRNLQLHVTRERWPTWYVIK